MGKEALSGDKLTWRHIGFMVAVASFQFFGVALQLNSAGIFYSRVAEEFGVGLGQVSFYISVAYIVSIFLLPVGERLMHKISLRVIYVTANLALGLAFLINSFSVNVWMLYAGGALMAGCITFNMYLMPVLVSRWFKKRTGLVVGFAGSMSGLGAAVMNPVGSSIIEAFGWRAGYLAFALLVLLVVVPLVFVFVRTRPEDVGVRAYGASIAGETADPGESAKLTGADYRAVIKSPAFPLLILMAICGGSVAVMPQYMTAFALDAGYLAIIGASMTSAAMVGNMCSKILLGSVADRNISIAVFVAVFFPILALAGLMAIGGSSATLVVATAFFFGFVTPSNTVILPLVIQKKFGDKDYSRIWASVSPFSAIACATGATIWGWVYDGAGSFHIVFIIGIALLCLRLASYLVVSRTARKIPHTDAR